MRSRSEQLVQESLPLVRRVAIQLARRLPPSIELSDLVQSGMLGLLDAATKFDASKGVRFGSYAELRIRGAILDGLRELDWVPRSVRRRRRELEAAIDRLDAALGRVPSEREIATELEVSVLDVRRASATVEMVDYPEGIESLIPDPHAVDPHVGLERREMIRVLAEAIETLGDRERLVMALYYADELTMREVGEALGVNESRVSQIHGNAMRILRKRVSAKLSVASVAGLPRSA